jgi:hypothetical protein
MKVLFANIVPFELFYGVFGPYFGHTFDLIMLFWTLSELMDGDLAS